jgi:hypothetical protein
MVGFAGNFYFVAMSLLEENCFYFDFVIRNKPME